MNQMKLNNVASKTLKKDLNDVIKTDNADTFGVSGSCTDTGAETDVSAKSEEQTGEMHNSDMNSEKNESVDGKHVAFSSTVRSFSDRRRIVVITFSIVMGLFVLLLSIDATAIVLYKNEDERLVRSICSSTVEKMKTAVSESYDFSILNGYADEYMGGFSDIQNMQFFLCNSRGDCIANSSNYEEDREKIHITKAQSESLKESGTFEPSMYGIKSYSMVTLSYGTSFSVETKGIEEEYYLLAVYPDKNFEKFSFSLVGISAGIFLVVLAVVLIVLKVQYRNYVKYFTVYSEVVQRYARDDFSIKMPVPAHTKSDYFVRMIEATNELAVNIETSEERRKQFISNVSHELRTPMTSICGFVDGILDGTIPKNEHRKYLTIVSQETRRLKNMIQSMLNLTRIESGTLQLPKAEFNLTDVALRTLFLFENQIRNKNIEVECNVEETYKINGNQDYIQQVVYNLVENAVKFVNENGTITLTIEKSRDDSGFVDVSIRNTGEGLSSEEIPKVFDRFYKTDRSRSKDKTGLGLGLTICRRIVYLHGGTIMVRSTEGEYTEFTIHLPFNGLEPEVPIENESKG